MIVYGGHNETVLKQLSCKHNWHGPCIDNISRYFKCLLCFALERDLPYTKNKYEPRIDPYVPLLCSQCKNAIADTAYDGNAEEGPVFIESIICAKCANHNLIETNY